MIHARLASGLGARAFTALVVGAVLTLSAAAFTPVAGAAQHRRCAHANSSVGTASPRALRRAVLCLINRQRTARHLPRLHASKRLNRSAQGWTNTMVRSNIFTHGADFAARITSVGFDWSTAGENIAAGYSTPASVVRAWMASPDHCRNILTPNFLDVGTGLSRVGTVGTPAGTWTQDFALPMSANARSHNWGPADGCPYG